MPEKSDGNDIKRQTTKWEYMEENRDRASHTIYLETSIKIVPPPPEYAKKSPTIQGMKEASKRM